MNRSDDDLMRLFMQLRKEAFNKLASPLRDAAFRPYENATQGLKTASECAAVDKALFLHLAVP